MSRPVLALMAVVLMLAAPIGAEGSPVHDLSALEAVSGAAPSETETDGTTADPRAPVRAAADDLTEGMEGRTVATTKGLLGLLLGLPAFDLLFGAPSGTTSTVSTPLGPVPEEAVFPLSMAGVAALGLLALLGVWARKMGWLSGASLFTRIQKDDLLKHEARAHVFEYIRANPGTNITEISRDLGLAWGTVTHHLEKLRSGRLISMRCLNNQKCWFENGGAVAQADMVALSALKRGTVSRIAAYVARNPGVSQKALAEALGMSRAAASFHVRKLAKNGVLARARAGKEMRLTLMPEAVRSLAANAGATIDAPTALVLTC